MSHQKRSPLQSHKDKAYGTLLPGICIRTAASLERIGVESVLAPGVFQTFFFTLISHKIVSKNCKTILPYVFCISMLVSAVSFNDWNFVGGPVDPLRLKISEQQQYLKKKIGEIDFFAQVGSSIPSLY